MIVAHRLTYCAKSSTLCIPLGYIEPVAVKSPSHVFRRWLRLIPKILPIFRYLWGHSSHPRLKSQNVLWWLPATLRGAKVSTSSRRQSTEIKHFSRKSRNNWENICFWGPLAAHLVTLGRRDTQVEKPIHHRVKQFTARWSIDRDVALLWSLCRIDRRQWPKSDDKTKTLQKTNSLSHRRQQVGHNSTTWVWSSVSSHATVIKFFFQGAELFVQNLDRPRPQSDNIHGRHKNPRSLQWIKLSVYRFRSLYNI